MITKNEETKQTIKLSEMAPKVKVPNSVQPSKKKKYDPSDLRSRAE